MSNSDLIRLFDALVTGCYFLALLWAVVRVGTLVRRACSELSDLNARLAVEKPKPDAPAWTKNA